MSESENFLARWSRRKLAQDKPSMPDPTGSETPSDKADQPTSAEAKDGETISAGTHPIDPDSLPTIESISANTSVAAFLRPGVPAELTRAALRRAWTSDPAIRDFVGLVENGWDFNNPDAVAGFASVGPEEVARLVSQMAGRLSKVPVESEANAITGSANPADTSPSDQRSGIVEPQRVAQNDAVQKGGKADSTGRT
jgi:Protein of unknown function (DUF3306)